MYIFTNQYSQPMIIEELLKFNKEFVESKSYERFATSKYPDKKLAILSCMDTRLTELLPAALGLRTLNSLNGCLSESWLLQEVPFRA